MSSSLENAKYIRPTAVDVSVPRNDASTATSLAGWLRTYGLAIALYIAVIALTGAQFMGDTVGYAEAIVESKLFEFGHFLWFPLGWILSAALGPFTGLDARMNVIFALVAANWIAGLLSVVLIYSLVIRIAQREWVANLVTSGFIISQGFLDLAQTGCSYIPGLALLMLGLWLMIREEQRRNYSLASAVLAGSAFAAAIGLWFPYVTVVPGTLTASLFIFGFTRERFTFAARAAVVLCGVGALIYGSAAAAQGIHTWSGLRDWIHSSSHGITDHGNLPRLVFSIPRSFTFTGHDGVLFKRFLHHDPFNPVSFMGLVGAGLWKLLFFYLLLGATVLGLMRSMGGRRFLLFLTTSAVPLTALALYWEAGAIERYVPLYPAIFLCFAYLLSQSPPLIAYRFLLVAWIAANLIVNFTAMTKSTLAERQERVAARIEALEPVLKPKSSVATISQQDELWAFYWDFPFHPINRHRSLAVFHIQEPGTTQILVWRQEFATKARSVWSDGGDLWISKRVLSPRPAAEWNWVEGEDPRISWADIYGYFSQFEFGQAVGGEDGFYLLSPSAKNKQLMAALRSS
jgi:hypothetical protein